MAMRRTFGKAGSTVHGKRRHTSVHTPLESTFQYCGGSVTGDGKEMLPSTVALLSPTSVHSKSPNGKVTPGGLPAWGGLLGSTAWKSTKVPSGVLNSTAPLSVTESAVNACDRSKAPMSHDRSLRLAPRASVWGDTALLPAFTAGLLDESAMVWTRPPLSASAPSWGSVVVAPQVLSPSMEVKTTPGRPKG